MYLQTSASQIEREFNVPTSSLKKHFKKIIFSLFEQQISALQRL
jgi:hypothetical protein